MVRTQIWTPPRWTRSRARKLDSLKTRQNIITMRQTNKTKTNQVKSENPPNPPVPAAAPCVKKEVTPRRKPKPIKIGKMDENSSNSASSTCACLTHIRGFCVTIYTGDKLQDAAHRRCKYFLKGQA
ncbi:uncharacterized protein LOC119081503 [Bradysia coprophila]|uniref:uncharacterized protein LOC119081503 n=1 Tax=Bradysia coprophila TaxID=38358 RepID=UPI00187DB86E|nr:uncharacterized protein LOC119081503 [Bradysia coprophila]